MSSGRYTRSKYEADSGDIHPIRVQPETLAATVGGGANAAPGGTITSPISAKVSKSNRGVGLKPRTVTIVFDEGAAPAGYADNSPITIPVLTPARYTAIAKGATGTYLGAGVTVVSKSPERVG